VAADRTSGAGAAAPAPAPVARPVLDPDPARAGQRGAGVLPDPRQLLALIAIAVLSYAAILVIRSLRGVLVMLLVALFISFAVEPAVQWFARRGWRRGAATLAIFVGAALVLLGSVGSILPLLVDQVSALLRAVPDSVAEINDLLDRLPVVELQIDPDADLNQELARLGRELGGGGLASAATGNLLGAAGSVLGIGATAVGLVFQLLTVLLVAFYMTADGPRLRAALARPLPAHRQRELLAIWEIAVTKTGGYIYSRVLLAAVAAAATAVVVALIGIPYALPLGLWVGVTGAFVPVVGTYLGGVLVIVVALAEDPPKALWAIAFFVVYQQLENYLIAPRLQSATMDVHPAVAFVSVIVGATLLGAVGALLALPAAAIIQAVTSTYVHRHALIDELMQASTELEHEIPDRLAEDEERTGAR
jgi:predicted PurR-regulated permease PerM